MKVGVLYNYVDDISKGLDSDKISDNEIVETVEHVIKSLNDENELIPLRVSREFLSNFNPESLDMIFNLCEGFEGDSSGEPKVASFLDLMKIPYTGNCPYTLELCLDKFKTKQVLDLNKIPTPKYFLFTKEHLEEGNFPKHKLKFPVIVKPSKEDASVGITTESIVYNDSELLNRVRFVIETYKQPAIVEEFIEGRELNVAIIGNGENCEVLPISEILLLNGSKIVCFDSKWSPESKEYKNTVGSCPASLPKWLTEKVKKVALNAYKATNCRDYARVDIRLRRSTPYVIEVNPNPGINKDSGFYRSAKTAGMSYKDMIYKIYSYAVKRNGFRKNKNEKFEYETEKLILKKPELSDLSFLVDSFNNKEISKFMDNPEGENCTIQDIFESFFEKDKEEYNLVVFDKATNQRVGYCSLYDITPKTAELSMLVGNPNFNGKGYGKEMVKALIDISKNILKLEYLTGSVVEENIASIKCLEKNGFERTGKKYGSHVLKGKAYDEILFTKRLDGNNL